MRRAQAVTTPELHTWVDSTIMAIGSNMDLARREGDVSFIREAQLCTDILQVLLNEVAVRAGVASQVEPVELPVQP